MREHLIKRLLLVVPTLGLVSLVVFGLIRFVPGDMVDLLADQRGVTFGMDAGKIRERLGLTKPIHVQYLEWIADIGRGDLGQSMWSRRSVTEEVARRFPVTLELAVLTVIISTAWGLLVGIISAIHQESWLDYYLRTMAVVGLSVPYFWSSILVLVLASVYFNWSPDPLYAPLLEEPWTNLKQMVLPATVFAFYIGAPVARMARSTMLEVLRADYIRTAWAMGLPPRTIIWRHALKNAFISVMTIIGLQAAWAVSGLVLIESIWNLPGIGKYVVDVVMDRDYPMLQGLVLFIAAMVVAINLAVDLSYAWLDPRIRHR
jgi:peptide/nickel transport system permease protein